MNNHLNILFKWNMFKGKSNMPEISRITERNQPFDALFSNSLETLEVIDFGI